MSQGWDSWYIEFEVLNGELDIPVYVSANDLEIFEECWKRGITADEALENALVWRW
jgi:hypothetical protein